MSSSASLHSQLTSIMEVFTKAAVAEICKLVEDGYSVLRLEVTRSQKENEALKRKLMNTMEIGPSGKSVRRTARGRPLEVQSCSGTRLENEVMVFRKHVDVHQRDEPAVSEKIGPVNQSAPDRSACAEGEIRTIESIIIKEEGLEEGLEHLGPKSGAGMCTGRAAESKANEGDSPPTVDAEATPVQDAEGLAGQQRLTHGPWANSELYTTFKVDQENQSSGQKHSLSGTGLGSIHLNSLSYDYVVYDGPGQLETFFTQASLAPKTVEHACCFSKESSAEGMPINSELLFDPFEEKGVGNNSLSPGSQDEKPDVIMVDLVDNEVHPCSPWHSKTLTGSVQDQQRSQKQFGEKETIEQSSYSLSLSQSQMLKRENILRPFDAPGISGCHPGEENLFLPKTMSAYHKAQTREKRYTCPRCRKSFTCLKNLETHQRVHTGERPFSCTQCGKRFSQSAHLKKHLSVHTGEKPFSCTKCGKCFADSSNLKRHQSVHTGERPFRCAHCGKRFSLIGNLKRHQSIHLGTKHVIGQHGKTVL